MGYVHSNTILDSVSCNKILISSTVLYRSIYDDRFWADPLITMIMQALYNDLRIKHYIANIIVGTVL